MKQLLLVLIYIIAVSIVIAQGSSDLDALILKAEALPDNSQKVEQYNEIAWQAKNKDLILAETYAHKADSLASIIGDMSGKATSYVRKGVIYFIKIEYVKALVFFEEAITLRTSLKDWIGIANVINNIALVKKKQGDLQDAKKTYLRGLAYLDNLEAPLTIRAKILNNLGDLLKEEGDYQAALLQIEASEKERELLKDTLGISNVLLNKANLFFEIGNFKKAEDTYLKGWSIVELSEDNNLKTKYLLSLGFLYYETYNNDKAITFYKKALECKGTSIEDLALSYNNLGRAFQRVNKLDEGVKYFKKSIQLLLSRKQNNELGHTYFYLGQLNYENRDYDQAIHYLTLADTIARKNGEPYILAQINDCFAKTYGQLGNYDKAYNHNEQYKLLTDSLNIQFIKAITYQRNQEEQKKEDEIKKGKIRVLIGGIILLLISLLASLLAFFAYKNRQQRRFAEYEADKAYQQVDDLLLTQELKMANAKLEGKNEEQVRIARDLHDSIGAMLSTVKLYFNNINEQFKEIKTENSQNHKKANDLLDKVCIEVRRIAHNMETGTLTKFGLIEGIKELIHTINDSKQINSKLYVHNIKERFNPEKESKIYKIILELVGNVLKHSKADKLTVQLNRIDDNLNIVIEDNGRGFNAEDALAKDGMGLRNITLRVADLNGVFHIDSGKGNGTTVSVDIPISMN